MVIGPKGALGHSIPVELLLVQAALSCGILLRKRWPLKWYTGLAAWWTFQTTVASPLPLAGFNSPVPTVEWAVAVLMAAAAIYGWDRQRESDA